MFPSEIEHAGVEVSRDDLYFWWKTLAEKMRQYPSTAGELENAPSANHTCNAVCQVSCGELEQERPQARVVHSRNRPSELNVRFRHQSHGLG